MKHRKYQLIAMLSSGFQTDFFMGMKRQNGETCTIGGLHIATIKVYMVLYICFVQY